MSKLRINRFINHATQRQQYNIIQPLTNQIVSITTTYQQYHHHIRHCSICSSNIKHVQQQRYQHNNASTSTVTSASTDHTQDTAVQQQSHSQQDNNSTIQSSPSFSERMNNTVQNAVKQVVKSAAKQAVGKLKNGMLSDDDYYVNGIPPCKYSLKQLYQQCLPSQTQQPQHINGETTTSAATTTQYNDTTLETIFSAHRHIDPYTIVGSDISDVTDNITSELIGTDHPVLRKVANYFFNVSGKRVRPAIVFLVSRAVNNGLNNPQDIQYTLQHIHDKSIYTNSIQQDDVIDLKPSQRRISEITEMIHTASLLHDDVVDGSSTRRGVPTVNSVFGNKLAILGGDFLLARSSLAMGRLRNDAVTESVSTVIEHLVKGEIMQLKPDYTLHDTDTYNNNIQIYLTKSFYKTASLIAYACRAVATLSGQDSTVQDIAFEYGKNIGLAFQIIDDVLDITGNELVVGKAVGGADLTAGVLTLPLLYAAENNSELRSILAGKTKLKDPVQVRRALDITVNNSDGIERSINLAQEYIDSAVASVLLLRPSVYQSALIRLAEMVLKRQK